MRVTTENTKKTAETETKNASVKKADEQSTESARKKAEKPKTGMQLQETIHIF